MDSGVTWHNWQVAIAPLAILFTLPQCHNSPPQFYALFDWYTYSLTYMVRNHFMLYQLPLKI